MRAPPRSRAASRRAHAFRPRSHPGSAKDGYGSGCRHRPSPPRDRRAAPGDRYRPGARRISPPWRSPGRASHRRWRRDRRAHGPCSPADAPSRPRYGRRAGRRPVSAPSWQGPPDLGDIALELFVIVKAELAPAFLDLIDHAAELLVQPDIGPGLAAVIDELAVAGSYFRGTVAIDDIP